MANDNVLKQNMEEESPHTAIYMMWLLFKEKCEMPSAKLFKEKLQEKLGGIDTVSEEGEVYNYALLSHLVTYENGTKAPANIMITRCNEVKKPHGDNITRSQFWSCENGVELLDSCKYQVLISDFMAAGLPAQQRATMLADVLEVALELFPSCDAVYSAPSGKLLTADAARQNPYEGILRYMWFGVNARFFNVEGKEDKVVDTLGLYALGLPDVQYHFHDLDVNRLVNHAYNLAIYQFQNDAPIKSGDTVDDIEGKERWKCQYESALIQPKRILLDVETGKNASGNRNVE